jgi:hypothetical protein
VSGNELGPAHAGIDPNDFSQAMLIGILMHNGGHYDLPLDALETDALGGVTGALHAVEMLPLPGGQMIRLRVVPRPETDNAVLRWQKLEGPPTE